MRPDRAEVTRDRPVSRRSGRAGRRVRGPDKVTGAARYAVRVRRAGRRRTAGRCSRPIARGRVALRRRRGGAGRARRARRAQPRERRAAAPSATTPSWPCCSPRRSRYRGQIVALVVADDPGGGPRGRRRRCASTTGRAARHRARPPTTPTLVRAGEGQPGLRRPTRSGRRRGRRCAAPAVTVDATYRRRPSTTTRWSRTPRSPRGTATRLTVYDSNQGGARRRATTLAALFGLRATAVRVVAEHVGGGFGVEGQPRAPTRAGRDGRPRRRPAGQASR